MRKYELNDRFSTADIGLDIWGSTLEELYIAGAEGLMSVFLGKFSGQTEEGRTIELEAGSINQLLIDWLSEFVYLFDAEGIVPLDYKVEINARPDGFRLKGEIGYRRFRPESDRAEHGVKAVTYYRLNVEQVDGIYHCHVVFDL